MKIKTNCPPEQLIAAIRASFIGAEQVYTQGSCIAFYKILKLLYPGAIAYWSTEVRHMVTKIGNKYYDITGEVPASTVKAAQYKPDADTWLSMSIAVAIPGETLAKHNFPVPHKLNA